MAIVPATEFPGKIDPADAEYPQGKARNVAVQGDGTGTPWLKNPVNDIWGLLQRLLLDAGITPSGNPDTVLASDYKDALDAIFARLGSANTFAGSVTVDSVGNTHFALSRFGVKVSSVGSDATDSLRLANSSDFIRVRWDLGGSEGIQSLGIVPLARMQRTEINGKLTGGTIGAGFTNLVTIVMGTVNAGDRILIDAAFDATKGGTSGRTSIIIASSGTATMLFKQDFTAVVESEMSHPNGTVLSKSIFSIGRVTTGGTLSIILQGISSGSDCSAVDAQINAIVLNNG